MSLPVGVTLTAEIPGYVPYDVCSEPFAEARNASRLPPTAANNAFGASVDTAGVGAESGIQAAATIPCASFVVSCSPSLQR